ncbi:MAG: HD domain-containing phosphohydrolase [Planctomycetota bacterium]
MQSNQSGKVLFVDDDIFILEAARRQFRRHFDITIAESGQIALEKIKSEGPYAVIVSDRCMPGMDGIDFFSNVCKISPDSSRIMMTGDAEFEAAMKAVNEGQIFRFLTKPCPRELLQSTIEAGLEQYRLVTSQKILLTQTLQGSIRVLTEMLSLVSADTFGHSERIKSLATAIAKEMNLPSSWQIKIAAMLALIGCVTVPSSILRKHQKGVRLNSDEQEIYCRHPQIGHDLISNIPRLENIAEIVLYQEKNYDGTGFPEGKQCGQDIPIESRIIKVAASYVKWIDRNCTPAGAIQRLKNTTHYDPEVIVALEKIVQLLSENQVATVQTIRLSELRPGMIINKDVKTIDGSILLVKKGQEISEILLQRVMNFHKQSPVMDVIEVVISDEKNVSNTEDSSSESDRKPSVLV